MCALCHNNPFIIKLPIKPTTSPCCTTRIDVSHALRKRLICTAVGQLAPAGGIQLRGITHSHNYVCASIKK